MPFLHFIMGKIAIINRPQDIILWPELIVGTITYD